jgi:hypothetical protein
MQWSKWSYAGSLSVALLAGSSSAHGQTAEAKAEELFNRAVELSESQKYGEACPLLAESQKLDPRASTLFALADCEREAEKWASSVAHFKEYLTAYAAMKADARRRHDQRASIAKVHIKKIEPSLPILKFTFATGIPGDFVVLHNGNPVYRIMLDKEIPVDPGEQVIVVKVPGHEETEQRITLALKDKKVVELLVGAVSTNQDDNNDNAKSNIRSKAGFVLLGTGVAGLAFGGVMGALAIGQKGKVLEHCNGLDCNPTGLEAVKQGRTFGNMSTIGIAAGSVVAATGLVLILTAPKSQSKTGLITGVGGAASRYGAFLSMEGQF